QRAEERAFEVIARHHLGAEAAVRNGAVEAGEPRLEVGLACGDERRQAPGDPGPQHGCERQIEPICGDAGVVEIDARVPVHLQIEQAVAFDHRDSPLADARSRWSIASACCCRMLAGQCGVTGPSTAARTATALRSSGTDSTI